MNNTEKIISNEYISKLEESTKILKQMSDLEKKLNELGFYVKNFEIDLSIPHNSNEQ